MNLADLRKFEKDKKAWKAAQRVHQLEHASGIDRTLPCDAVAHLRSIDDYQTYFDADEQRKFCMATGRDW